MTKLKLHLHIIANPEAGSGNAKKALTTVNSLLNDKKIPYTNYLTTYPGHEKRIAQQLLNDVLIPWKKSVTSFPLLVVLGGDGTIHGVVNSLINYPTIPIAYLAVGSGNDFARGLSLPKKIEQSLLRILATKQPTDIQLIATHFDRKDAPQLVLNNIGIGLDARIVATANSSVSKRKLNQFHLGSLAYLAAIIRVLKVQKSFPITLKTTDNQIEFKEAYLCTITNHPFFGGGVPIDPTASVKKEEMSLVLYEKKNGLILFSIICRLLVKKHLTSKYIRHLKVKELTIHSPEAEFCQTDGEIMEPSAQHVHCQMTSRLFWL